MSNSQVNEPLNEIPSSKNVAVERNDVFGQIVDLLHREFNDVIKTANDPAKSLLPIVDFFDSARDRRSSVNMAQATDSYGRKPASVFIATTPPVRLLGLFEDKANQDLFGGKSGFDKVAGIYAHNEEYKALRNSRSTDAPPLTKNQENLQASPQDSRFVTDAVSKAFIALANKPLDLDSLSKSGEMMRDMLDIVSKTGGKAEIGRMADAINLACLTPEKKAAIVGGLASALSADCTNATSETADSGKSVERFRKELEAAVNLVAKVGGKDAATFLMESVNVAARQNKCFFAEEVTNNNKTELKVEEKANHKSNLSPEVVAEIGSAARQFAEMHNKHTPGAKESFAEKTLQHIVNKLSPNGDNRKLNELQAQMSEAFHSATQANWNVNIQTDKDSGKPKVSILPPVPRIK